MSSGSRHFAVSECKRSKSFVTVGGLCSNIYTVEVMFTVLEPDEPTKRYWQMGQQPNCFCVPISSTWVRGGIYIIICFQGVLHWMTGRFSLFVSYISLLATTVFPFASLPHHFTNALGPGGQLPTSSLLPLSEMVFWGSPCNGLFQKSISTAMRIAEPHLCRTESSSSARSQRSVAWEPSFASRRKKMICHARVWFGTRVCHPLGWWWRHGQSAWCHAPHSSANPWGPCRGCWPGAERCLLHLLCHFPPGAGKSMQLGTRYNIDLIVFYLFDWPVRQSWTLNTLGKMTQWASTRSLSDLMENRMPLTPDWSSSSGLSFPLPTPPNFVPFAITVASCAGFQLLILQPIVCYFGHE